MKYYWRIKLWDESDNEGEWTNGNDYFIMAGKRIQDLNYTYDDVGNILEIIDQSETNTRKYASYAYDDLYRLTSATITESATEDDYTQTFSYDSLGNILNKSDVGDYEYNGNAGSLYANPHAVTDFTDLGVEVSYDNNGNMDAETLGVYTVFEADWDYNNRMTASDGVFATPASYGYDHSGQRIIKDIDSGSEIIVYPNKYFDKKIVGEDETITENIYANNQLVLTITDDGTNRNEFYVHDDHLTSSSVMTKDDGEVEQVVDYYPFGNMRFNEQSDPGNSFDQRLKFTQKEFESDASGLQYFGARYYSGEAGKFVSQDRVFQEIGSERFYKLVDANYQGEKKKQRGILEKIILNPQSMNSYSYVNNNPLRLIDPTGNLQVQANGASESEKQTFQQGLQQLVSLVSNNQQIQDYFSLFNNIDIVDVLTNNNSGPLVNLNSLSRRIGLLGDSTAKYNFVNNSIYMNGRAFESAEAIGQTLIHELGHWANDVGKWFGNINPNMSNFRTSAKSSSFD